MVVLLAHRARQPGDAAGARRRRRPLRVRAADSRHLLPARRRRTPGAGAGRAAGDRRPVEAVPAGEAEDRVDVTIEYRIDRHRRPTELGGAVLSSAVCRVSRTPEQIVAALAAAARLAPFDGDDDLVRRALRRRADAPVLLPDQPDRALLLQALAEEYADLDAHADDLTAPRCSWTWLERILGIPRLPVVPDRVVAHVTVDPKLAPAVVPRHDAARRQGRVRQRAPLRDPRRAHRPRCRARRGAQPGPGRHARRACRASRRPPRSSPRPRCRAGRAAHAADLLAGPRLRRRAAHRAAHLRRSDRGRRSGRRRVELLA